MSNTTPKLLAVYVEGETKTGKGAASAEIARALKARGLNVYYDVAGDFFRRYVAIIRRQLGLSETDELPPTDELVTIATELFKNGAAFEKDETLGDLQRSSISRSVSLLGELPIAQEAAGQWYEMSVQQAIEANANVMVLDGRNPRMHVEILTLPVTTMLDIYMICDPKVAAQRILLGYHNAPPDQLERETANIIDRRNRDRHRAEWAYVEPKNYLSFDPNASTPDELVAQSWIDDTKSGLPRPIVVDNSLISKNEMFHAVANLATTAHNYAIKM